MNKTIKLNGKVHDIPGGHNPENVSAVNVGPTPWRTLSVEEQAALQTSYEAHSGLEVWVPNINGWSAVSCARNPNYTYRTNKIPGYFLPPKSTPLSPHMTAWLNFKAGPMKHLYMPEALRGFDDIFRAIFIAGHRDGMHDLAERILKESDDKCTKKPYEYSVKNCDVKC